MKVPSLYVKNCEGRDNHFNLIRFFAAIAVIFSHSYDLSLGSNALEPLKKLTGYSLGSLAVDIFFFTSGYLVTASLLKKKNSYDYFKSRILRVYPGLIFSVILTTFLLWLLLSKLSFYEFFSSSLTLEYIIKNSTLIFGVAYELPNTFHENPYPIATNGSLWSLPHEIRAYIALYLMFYVLKKTRLLNSKEGTKAIFLLVWCSVAFIPNTLILFDISTPHTVNLFFPLFNIFLSGSLIYLFREKITLSVRNVFICVTLSFVLYLFYRNLAIAIYPLILGYIVIFLSYFYKGFLLNFNRLGDYSYGLYIYAFPIQQYFVSTLTNVTVMELFFLSLITSIAFAIISWFLIEKPILNK